ncbi:serine hydrolase, partial [Streptomyces sp. DT225]
MTMSRTTGRARAALCAAVAAGVLAPVALAAAPASAATAQVSCTSKRAGLAAQLTKDITAALKGRKSTVALALYDRSTATTCTLRATSTYDSASVVKATVLATLLWDNAKHKRYLTQREIDLSTKMITKSDNDATTSLWKQLGVSKV